MVNVAIISEKEAQTIQCTNVTSTTYQSGELLNCFGNLEFSTATNHLSAEFKNLQLKNAKRGDKSGDDKIVDEKYALFFQANISVGEMVFAVWAMSLPLVVISHAKQNVCALATVIWDNAFSELYRVPFEEPEKVKWSQLAEMLNQRFILSTGCGLTPANLHFLCEKLLRRPLAFPIPADLEITRAQFCKDFIAAEFTFWTWFYMAKELTREHLREPWADGLIAGFINKSSTECLYNRPPGTFLLRFSESVLGELSVSVLTRTQRYRSAKF